MRLGGAKTDDESKCNTDSDDSIGTKISSRILQKQKKEEGQTQKSYSESDSAD